MATGFLFYSFLLYYPLFSTFLLSTTLVLQMKLPYVRISVCCCFPCETQCCFGRRAKPWKNHAGWEGQGLAKDRAYLVPFGRLILETEEVEASWLLFVLKEDLSVGTDSLEKKLCYFCACVTLLRFMPV